MKKKILAALLCAALALTMTACAASEEPTGSTSKKDKSSKNSVTESVTTPSDSDNTDSDSAGDPDTSSTTDSKPEETSTPAGSGIDWDNVPYADELDFMCVDYDPKQYSFKDDLDALFAGGVVIYKYTGSDKLIKIPETIDGKPVVGICGKSFAPGEYCFSNFSDISVMIPDNLSFILKGFEWCNNLTVDFPAYKAKSDIAYDCRSLRNNSFAACTNLKLNMEPNSVGALSANKGYAVFDGCTFNGAVVMPDSLTSISEPTFLNYDDHYYDVPQVFPEAIVYKGKTYDFKHIGAFFDKVNKSKFDESGTKIEDGVLTSVSRATEGTFTVPDSVTSIGKNAFNDCLDITEVIIPDSVTKIDKNAFSSNYNVDFNVTYKGKTYKPNQLENLIKAVNGN